MSKYEQKPTTHIRIRKSTQFLLRKLNEAFPESMIEIMDKLVRGELKKRFTKDDVKRLVEEADSIDDDNYAHKETHKEVAKEKA